jgi:tRNA1Val (adenine37-N6)-methyltransferase
MFHFKQFSVDQSGCAMKINTDGVLLGAFVESGTPKTILDIGTGTGVIALMLAQRFKQAIIDAVEIDPVAAQTASNNFKNSSFDRRIALFAQSFEDFFDEFPDRTYDLIVSNPPFFIHSLKSPKAKKELAKHTDQHFFKRLIAGLSKHLTIDGVCQLILPVETADLVRKTALEHGLFVKKTTKIYSYKDSEAHRELLALSRDKTNVEDGQFVIYDSPKIYSQQYQEALKDFFTIF